MGDDVVVSTGFERAVTDAIAKKRLVGAVNLERCPTGLLKRLAKEYLAKGDFLGLAAVCFILYKRPNSPLTTTAHD